MTPFYFICEPVAFYYIICYHFKYVTIILHSALWYKLLISMYLLTYLSTHTWYSQWLALVSCLFLSLLTFFHLLLPYIVFFTLTIIRPILINVKYYFNIFYLFLIFFNYYNNTLYVYNEENILPIAFNPIYTNG